MKKDIHPKYGPVIFHDTSCDEKFLISSTFTSKETMKWKDGKEYPVCKLDTSSASHPIFTGKGRIEVSEGQVAKFRKRFGKASAPAAAKDAAPESDAPVKEAAAISEAVKPEAKEAVAKPETSKPEAKEAAAEPKAKEATSTKEAEAKSQAPKDEGQGSKK